MDKNIVSITKGNMKLGEKETWNINLPPHLSCKDKPCFKEGCCYNFKAWRQYPNVRESWGHNSDLYSSSPKKYFDSVIDKIKKATKPPKFFRWHAAGEIPDQEYFRGIKRVAREFPKIKFLCFTKQYHLYFREIPENLQVIISAWPGLDIPKSLRKRFPVAWMMDGRENRKPRNPVECPGHCPSCRACWNLSKMKRDVVFHKH
jgi:hypothetical protein